MKLLFRNRGSVAISETAVLAVVIGAASLAGIVIVGEGSGTLAQRDQCVASDVRNSPHLVTIAPCVDGPSNPKWWKGIGDPGGDNGGPVQVGGGDG